jgi:hypothetical protein
MAETKAKAGTKKAKPKARGSTKAKPGAAKPQSTRAKPRKRSASKAKPTASKAAPSKPQAAREAVESTAKDAGGAVSSAAGKVGHAASKAKVPLMAGGAAIAGAAGGLALGARQTHRKSGLGKVSSKDLAKAARKAGDVGAQVGEIALEVKRARERTNGNGGAHRSPIEVVLQGLTSRGSRQ